jgi:hypothetical protein
MISRSDRPRHAADRAHVGRGLALLFASGVVIEAWALYPSTVEKGINLPLPEASTPPAAKAPKTDVVRSPVNPDSSARTEPLLSTKPMSSPKVAAPRPTSAVYPSVADAMSRVSVKAKLQVLFKLLVTETDPVARANFEKKLQALAELPEDVLVEVLQHPELTDFNKMLDAVFIGDTQLWWIELELAKINVVPVAQTIDRIDVSGTPAFTYDSAAAAHKDSSGKSTSGLKKVTPKSSAPPASATMTSRSAPDAGVSASATPAPSAVQVSKVSRTVPVTAAAPLAASTAAPSPSPSLQRAASTAPSPEPAVSPAPTLSNVEVSREPVGTKSTTTSQVVNTGNKVEPETKQSEPVTTTSGVADTATTSPSPVADTKADASPPSGDTNGGNTVGDTNGGKTNDGGNSAGASDT